MRLPPLFLNFASCRPGGLIAAYDPGAAKLLPLSRTGKKNQAADVLQKAAAV
jgi:hypothetical protein